MKTLSVKWLWIIIFPVIVASCTGCSTVRKAYWDHQVKAMCLKDAGVTVYERVGMSRIEYENLVLISLNEELPKPQKYYNNSKSTYIKDDGNILVSKLEEEVIRKKDRKVLGRKISYFRRGGDSQFNWPHPTKFSCKNIGMDLNIVTSIFYVDQNISEGIKNDPL